MTTTRSEQESLLAQHRRQFDGYMKTIASIEVSKADGSIDAELADSQIERWSIFAAATQSDIDDCLANIAGLDMPDVLPAEASVDIPFQGAHELPPVETIPEPTIVDDDAPATKKKAKG